MLYLDCIMLSLMPPSHFLLFFSHTMSEYGRMTDTERDQIDQDAQIFIRTCSEAIQQLRTEGEVLRKKLTDPMNVPSS